MGHDGGAHAMSAKIPYRSPETPASPALRWAICVPKGDAADVVAFLLGFFLGAAWLIEAIGYVAFGATGAVLRGLLVCVLGTLVFCALFVRRVPEV